MTQTDYYKFPISGPFEALVGVVRELPEFVSWIGADVRAETRVHFSRYDGRAEYPFAVIAFDDGFSIEQSQTGKPDFDLMFNGGLMIGLYGSIPSNPSVESQKTHYLEFCRRVEAILVGILRDFRPEALPILRIEAVSMPERTPMEERPYEGDHLRAVFRIRHERP